MSPLLKDLVHDLREKRLWPVAALLLLAIVAIPAVLLRSPAEEPAPTPVAAPGGDAQAQAAVVALAGEDEASASALESFDAKDPFEPRGPAAPAQGEVPTGSEPAAGGAAGSVTPAPAPGGGSAPNPGPTAPPASGGSPDKPVSPRGGGEPRLYTYLVDVRFGRRGKERTYRGVDRMEPLPSSENPLLVFLGTTSSGRSAVFLVDQGLEQRGGGICQPNRSNCALLYMRLDEKHDLHYFTDTEGRGYALRLTDIDLVPVDEVEKRKKEQAGDAKRTRTERDDHVARWPYDVAPFADLAR